MRLGEELSKRSFDSWSTGRELGRVIEWVAFMVVVVRF